MSISLINLKSLTCLIMMIFSLADVSAQENGEDSVSIDTIRNQYLPTGIRIGTDVVSLVKSKTQDNFTGREITGEIDFNRYYLVLDYGMTARDVQSDSAAYSNDGKFWRVGVDVNFLKKDPDRNVFSLGARYGRSAFSEKMDLTSYDPIWGTQASQFSHSDVNAWWLELTAGLRVKIWKIFWLGYTGQLKFALSTDTTPEMLPYDVPGFGRTNKDTSWGFNYYLLIRIPLRKAPPVPASDKD